MPPGIALGLWLVFLPSMAIAVLAVAANLAADGVHEAPDPRRRPSGPGRRSAPETGA